ncbi:aldo/keto reductase [Clostridiaceae bacterium M8S5]|nr:aldo/keto reductase [Clostridiaceae bacterium M8S5]
MQYSKFGNTEIKLSKLGFGAMRLPTLNNDNSVIDEKKSKEMLYYAIDNGLNYVDTAYNYHGEKSEEFVGKALKNGYREKVYLATKLPVWKVEKYDDFEKLLDEQLKRLDTDYIDFYLLHSLGEKRWKQLVDLDVFKFMDYAKKSGKIKYMGFSFHDKFDAFVEILDSYDWDFCQIQLNYIDQMYQAGLKGLDYAYDRGIPVIIMEPIKGGSLAKGSEELDKLWNKMSMRRSPAQWALKWLFNNEKVMLVLSGMSEMKHVEENMLVADETKPNQMTDRDLNVIEEIKKVFEEKSKVNCTGCDYCLPCPNNIPIPFLFKDYNNIFRFDDKSGARRYKVISDRGDGVDACTACKKCEQMCPQHINIVEKLKELDEYYKKLD